jgi:hypothetical protein
MDGFGVQRNGFRGEEGGKECRASLLEYCFLVAQFPASLLPPRILLIGGSQRRRGRRGT